VFRYEWRNGELGAVKRIELRAKDPKKPGVRYPAGLAFSRDGKRLYVAENLSDTVAVIDVASQKVAQRVQTDRYPYAVVVSRRGDVYVSSWGDNTVVRFTSRRDGAILRERRISVARHPSAMLLDDTRQRLYVASASTDSISIVDVATGSVVNTLHDAPPGPIREGSTPNALALSRSGRLFVAEADANAVAVFSAGALAGRIPTAWYPAALVIHGDSLIIVNAKGNGTAPNPALTQPDKKRPPKSRDYTLGQLNGSVMTVSARLTADELRTLSKRVTAANGWGASRSAPRYPPLKHVIYIIKENRTYDQVFGDIPSGDGDSSLLFFGRDVTPNHHALAERFGLFDRFFVNSEVSADGHNWSTAAYATDYVQKTTPSNYSSRGRTYDYEGSNRDRVVDDDDDAAAPAAGYLWDLAVRKGITLRNYGEFVAKEEVAGTVRLTPTRRALLDRTNLAFAPFDLDVPDQQRADAWIADLKDFSARTEMPALQILHLPNDHTHGGTAGKLTPRAYVADNDLALGRIIEALSNSPFWKDTVVFVVEDDAQDGPDHVDSHRSPLLTISPYSRAGVIHRFANTTDVLATIEEILGLESLSSFDGYGRPLRDIFGTQPDLTPYISLMPAVDRTERNPPDTDAAKESARLDFGHADVADDDLFNRVLWKMIKGSAPYPAPRRAPLGGAQ
jgi:YVTN family beta-propeller protein